MTFYQKIIFILFLSLWGLLAIQPYDRWGWFLENIVILLAVPVIFIFAYRGYITNLSLTLILVFLALHTTGSHYAYDQVPFGESLGEWSGTERNSYDRLIHFSFGLLWVYPIKLWLSRLLKLPEFWSYLLPFIFILSLSSSYEIFEWIVAFQVNPEASLSFMGSQGDFWDTQKDMALAGCGALIAILAIFMQGKWGPKSGAILR